ncbi:MAG: Trigger factor [Gammaproteobacteria bacterium]|nr:Trigger factor [Gammaproteobacteria bacterium]
MEGFEAGLIGKKAGAEVILNLQFPDTYHVKDIAGKPVEFRVNINSVNEKVLPELNDEFYTTFGVEKGGMEAFRKQIKDHMEREVTQVLHNRLRESIIKALQDANNVELPKVMVASEKHRLMHQFEHNLKAQGLNTADIKHPEDDGIFEEQARNRVALQLLVGELIRLNNIKVDAEKVKQTVMQHAQNYQDPAAILNWYYNDKDRIAEIEALTLENQILDWIAERAKVTSLNLTFDECMNKGQTETD